MSTAPPPHHARSGPPPAAQAPPPQPPFEPAHRIASGAGQRRLRRLLATLGVAVVAVAIVSLAASSLISMRTASAFPLEHTRTGIGLPSTLDLEVDIGGVSVLPSSEVSEVTIGMAPVGARSFSPGEDEARARIHVAGGERTRVDVQQPTLSGPADMFRETSTNVLVLVPEGHALDLRLTVDAGSARVEGEHLSIDAMVDVGEVAIVLPEDSETPVTARVDVGDVRIAAPGSLRYAVTANADMGEARVDATLRAAAGEAATRISAEVSVGEVSVSR